MLCSPNAALCLLSFSPAGPKAVRRWIRAVSQQQITGYYQLTNDGATGPCRGTTPDDNDRSAYGTNLLTTDTTDCTSCAALCSANVNITGYPRECIAFECTPSTSDNVVGYESARFGRLRQREKANGSLV